MAELTREPSFRLEARGLTKSFGPTRAVAGVDFRVRPGEIRALVGENGAGKSTLMKLLSGVELPDEGELRLDGERYEPRSPRESRERGVVMVHQELSLAPHLTVAENLFLGMEPTIGGLLRRRRMTERAGAALAELERDDVPPDARVSSLPLAVRQIVEIARAVLLEARVVILDEPTSSLARPDVERLFRHIRRLGERGIAVVYISHFLEEVWEIAETFTVLRDGRSVGEGRIAETSFAEIVRLMVGREIQEMVTRSHRSAGSTLIEVRELAGVKLPRSASLELRRGEVLGVAGLMGAGRTELLRTIFGLDPVRRGEIRVGLHRGWARPRERLDEGIGLASEDRQSEGLAPSLSVAENLTLSRLSGLGPGGLVLPGRVDEVARRWIDELSIQCRGPRQRVSSLSGGNQQKIALGRLLYHDLDVLLLDEPTRGIDVGAKAAVYRLVDRLAGQGKAILLVSSYLPELLALADRIAVMRRGVLGPARQVSELTEEKVMAECTGEVTEAPA